MVFGLEFEFRVDTSMATGSTRISSATSPGSALAVDGIVLVAVGADWVLDGGDRIEAAGSCTMTSLVWVFAGDAGVDGVTGCCCAGCVGICVGAAVDACRTGGTIFGTFADRFCRFNFAFR